MYWKNTFQKVQKVPEIKRKWFQIILVQSIMKKCYFIEYGGCY